MKIGNKRLPCQARPCNNCPFRKDSPEGWLGNRIEGDVEATSFVCHKNTSLQCAGHMLLLRERNEFYALASAMARAGIIEFKLSGEELVFDDVKACIAHHKKGFT